MIQAKQNFEHLEKVFFAYCYDNPNYLTKVEPHYFINTELAFVFTNIKIYYTSQQRPHIPSPQKVLQLVRLQDPTAKIVSDSYIQTLLSQQVSDYEQGKDDDWLKKRLNSWIVYNRVYTQIQKSQEHLRELDLSNPDNVEEYSAKLRDLVNMATAYSFGDDNLGLDFDLPESHIQDLDLLKCKTGWQELDDLLIGGWAYKTLTCLMAPSNAGKSVWLANIACNIADHGKNVLYVTLEMPEKQVMKRLGAIRLKIPIDLYDTHSKDVTYMSNKIKELKKRSASLTYDSKLFDNPMGKIFVKEFPVGTASCADIEQLVKNYRDKKGIKIDAIVVDYLTIMKSDGKNLDMFTSGKQLAEGLRAIAQQYNMIALTAAQVGKDSWGGSDINLSDISQSKGIVETCDTMFGIIRTDEMRKQGKYILKLLKYRDGDFKWEKTHFDFNKTYLKCENAKKI